MRDINFVIHEVHDITSHYKKIGFASIDKDVVNDIVDHFKKFSEDVLVPLNEVSMYILVCVLLLYAK